MTTLTAIGIFLVAILVAFWADTRRDKARRDYPSATIRRLDEFEEKISD